MKTQTERGTSSPYEAEIRAAAAEAASTLVFSGVVAVGYVRHDKGKYYGVVMVDPGVPFESPGFRGKGAAEGWVREEFYREPGETNSFDRFAP